MSTYMGIYEVARRALNDYNYDDSSSMRKHIVNVAIKTRDLNPCSRLRAAFAEDKL